MPLTLKQVQDKCLSGQGSGQCRFLAEGIQGDFYCIKLTGDRQKIDNEVSEYKKRQKAQGVDPLKQNIPIGDNCQGYILLKHKMQGYDLKK